MNTTKTQTNGQTCGENQRSSFSYAFPCILQALHWTTRGRDPNLAGDVDVDIYGIPDSLRTATHVQVLVTGSLHLVGGVLGLVSPNLSD